MSTRCNIVVKKGSTKICLYHHFDGYPSGVGSILKDYLNTIIHWCEWDPYDIATNIIKGVPYTASNDDGTSSLEVDRTFVLTQNLHGDIEYVYNIDCKTRELTCYIRPFGTKVTMSNFTKLLTSIEIPD